MPCYCKGQERPEERTAHTISAHRRLTYTERQNKFPRRPSPLRGGAAPPPKKTSSFSFDRTLWPSKHPSSRSPGTTGGRPFFIRQAALAKRGGQAMAGGSAPRLQRNRRGRKGCSLQGSPCYARSCSSTWASAGRKPSSRASAGVTQRRFWPSVGQGSPLKRLTWKKCRRTRKPRSA